MYIYTYLEYTASIPTALVLIHRSNVAMFVAYTPRIQDPGGSPQRSWLCWLSSLQRLLG